LKSTHENEQQSGPEPQGAFFARHAPGTRAQVPVMSSQLPVQHSSSVEQVVPVTAQLGDVA
jgi:hypothetical protein